MTLSCSRGARVAALAALGLVLLAAVPMETMGAAGDSPSPSWIWMGPDAGDNQTVYFRKEFQAPAGVSSARLVATCDNALTVYLDGRQVVEGIEWSAPVSRDVTPAFAGKGEARHVLAVRGKNEGGPAGLLVRLTFETKGGGSSAIVTDDTWRVAARAARGWNSSAFDDASWARSQIVGALGAEPWLAINAAALDAAKGVREPQATVANTLKVKKDFKVDLVYTVPKETQGSWVNLTFDPEGRMIVSDQTGKLYYATLPPVGGTGEVKVEPIDVPIGEAQGLCWAFDSLYVVVNRGRQYQSGLYRVRDTDADGKLDKVEMLRKLDGGGEHGPHAVVPGPDGKSLYVVAGNATKLTELVGSLVPPIWGEDEVLPHMPDGRGFMADETAPGGCVYRVDPDGKAWTLVSMGYRNPYDLAFNRGNDLFTYDSDMEWDVNLPWYRPTRVCQVDSGSDFGYRNGSGKWPVYYPDSLPPTINIGPGSPTGIVFGYGAKFPARYQDALFICDWSYGKLYAVHLTPKGAEYTAELEEFVSGTPLPLTDIAVSPKDGAMYFAIGGRNTQSGLYRVTYTGAEATDWDVRANRHDNETEGQFLRHRLEAFHGHADPKAIETAWPHLGDADRFIRFAARVAIEFQPPDTWRDKALAESDPQAALSALLALARVSGRDPVHRKATDPAPDLALRGRILDALDRLDWAKLLYAQKLELLRVYGVLFARLGRPDEATASRVIARFDPVLPTRGRELNAELCQLLVSLQDPGVASKAIDLLTRAPTQEEQIDYARMLRVLKAGWTPELRKAYIAWFPRAADFKGGNSLSGFIENIKRDAVAGLSGSEKAELKPILDARPQAASVAAVPPRPFVKAWTVDELAPIVEKGLRGRDFDRGRSLFATAQCFACHRYNDEGGSTGPDLTGASGRFSVRDLLESIVQPNKTVSDQYQAVMIAMADGRTITGRIVNLHGDTISVNTNMLDPNGLVNLNRTQVEEMRPSPVSMMPEGLLNTLKQDEVEDLVAYLLSRGDRDNPMFESPRKP